MSFQFNFTLEAADESTASLARSGAKLTLQFAPHYTGRAKN